MKLAPCLLLLVACANASDNTGKPDGSHGSGSGSDGGGSGNAHACPDGQLATAIDPSGQVTCAAPDAPAKQAIDDNCTAYVGWRDDCNACTTSPAKWGRSGPAACMNGAGTNNTCTTPTLGGDQVRLFGLDPDGDVDGNDKLYSSLHCTRVEPTEGNLAPCPAGEFVTGLYATNWTCAPLASAVVDYVRASCQLYFGWQDGCDGCTSAPAKWGRSGDSGCQNGIGTDSTCSVAALGAETVNLFGLNPDGDVDGNDKLHLGISCAPGQPASSTSTTSCPAGQFVTGTNTDGSFQCNSVTPMVAQYFADHCSLYLGWQDGCDGCVTAPAKWGKAGVGSCTNGAGTDNTCTKFTLDGVSVDMFGLNPDGDVDGNDAIHIGLACK